MSIDGELKLNKIGHPLCLIIAHFLNSFKSISFKSVPVARLFLITSQFHILCNFLTTSLTFECTVIARGRNSFEPRKHKALGKGQLKQLNNNSNGVFYIILDH